MSWDIETFFAYLVVVIISDFIWRLYMAIKEYFRYSIYYMPEERISRIVTRLFYYKLKTRIFVLMVLFIHFNICITFLPPLKMFVIMPLYWLILGIELSHSRLDYALWLRSDHGLDCARGMVSNYFHGYLYLTLPSHSGHLGFHERIELYETQEDVKFALKRLIILIPKQMFIQRRFDSEILERAKPLQVVIKNRAGVFRPYQNDVYRFKIPIGPDNRFYYVAVEGATPLQSFYEGMSNNLTSTWQMHEMQREIILEFYRYLKKLCHKSPEIQNAVEIVLYDAYDTTGRLMDIGYIILAHLQSLWKQRKLET